MKFAVQRLESKFQIMYDIEYNFNLFHEPIYSASKWEIVTILLTILKVIIIIKLEDIYIYIKLCVTHETLWEQ